MRRVVPILAVLTIATHERFEAADSWLPAAGVD
jgi:hypothetical protein